jgi:hypothetical protein
MQDSDRPKIPDSSRPWGNFTLMLYTLDELLKLPDGTIIIDIFGNPDIKTENICLDTRAGFTAYGQLRETDD